MRSQKPLGSGLFREKHVCSFRATSLRLIWWKIAPEKFEKVPFDFTQGEHPIASSNTVITPFQRNKKVTDLRTHLNGPILLGKLGSHLKALEEIDTELEGSIKQFSRETVDQETGEVMTELYTSTTMDKETIAVYHTRMNARKMQIDTTLKMLNKVMPDLKAVEVMDDMANAADRALKAFALAASEE